jgi:hypothetical protein
MDRVYCPFGAYTLLQVAARMHALVLPFGNSEDTSVAVSEKADLLYGTDNPGGEAAGETVAKGQQSKGKNKPSGAEKPVEANAKEPENLSFSALAGANFDPPVTCRLELMFTADADPGIVCTGYIKEVSAKLKGPWLKGPDQSFNLPTWGEFSFVFVHRPGHFNSYSGKKGASSTTQQAQAYNEYVLERFYNTRSLSTTGDYRGFGDAAEVTPTPIVWQGPPVKKGTVDDTAVKQGIGNIDWYGVP